MINENSMLQLYLEEDLFSEGKIKMLFLSECKRFQVLFSRAD